MNHKTKRVAICQSAIDFDALASLMCITKLYPGIAVASDSPMERSVANFMGIYRNMVEFTNLDDIDRRSVEWLIIVDTRPSKRLQEFIATFPNLKKCLIFDHHDTGSDEVRNCQIVQKRVGSTTTILAPMMIQKKIYISPQEATLMLAAIYEDTASLVSPTTKPEDLDTAARLMSLGGNLQTVRRFISTALDERGKDILKRFLDAIEVVPMGGVLVAISCVKYTKYVENLAFITHKLFDLVEADAIFTASAFTGNTYFVGRSLDERLVDCARILSHFGGGGHKTASAAKIAGELDPKAAYNRLMSVCEDEIKPPPIVSSIMNHPVKSIMPNDTVKRAIKMLQRFGHGGLPVVNNKKLVGIVTRRDLDRVPPELGDKPVKRFMTSNPITIQATASIVEARRLMMKKGVGRLPVKDGDELVGIITRSDVLKANFWHRGQDIGPYPNPVMLSRMQTGELYKRLPQHFRTIIEKIALIAEGLGVNAYLVGGAVRDLVLDREPSDLDIVVGGDAINLAHAVSQAIGGRIISHERFGTARVSTNGASIDFATARAEFYTEPGSHPDVIRSGVIEDLRRRDFGVNALALGLTGSEAWRIIDVCAGLEDISKKQIRVLHNLSFIEDPTRILRAVYYSTILGFEIEDGTLKMAKDAVKTGLLSTAKNERTAIELMRILSHEYGSDMLVKLKLIGGLMAIFDNSPLYLSNMLKRIDKIRKYATKIGFEAKPELLRAMVITKDIDEALIEESLGRIRLSGRFIEKITKGLLESKALKRAIIEGNQVGTYKTMKASSQEAIVFSCLTTKLTQSLKLLERLNRIRQVKLEITGQDLIKHGIKPGKTIGSVLEKVLLLKIDGKISGYKDELNMASKLAKEE